MAQPRVSAPVLVAGALISLSLGAFIRTHYTAQIAFQSFILGLFTCSLLSLAAVGYFYKHSSPRTESLRKYRRVRFPPYAFIMPGRLEKELDLLLADLPTRTPLYPPSFVISSSLDLIIEYIVRDFILSWYAQVSTDSSFPTQVDNTIRAAIEQIRDRLLKVDLVDFTMQKIVPILTRHIADFAAAETALRGKNLNKQFTESRELDIALASKYNNGKLHPAASIRSPDPAMVEKEWIKHLVGSILPSILPEREAQSRSVFILVQEIVTGAVIFPIISMLEEPDTWNQLIERFASSTLQDRKAVQRLRAALDKHANPAVAKNQQPIVRLTAKSDERTYEKFVRGLRRCTLLSEARRLRYDITIQLKRAMKDGNDDLYIRRLKNARRLIDEKIADLSNETSTPSKRKGRTPGSPGTPGNQSLNDPRENYTVQQILNTSAGLSYFMEYMDRQHRTGLLQFYLVVDGFKNPLEEDDDDDDDAQDLAVSSSETFSESDREDISQIRDSYFSDQLLQIDQKYKDDIERFLSNPSATAADYQKARRAIMRAQKHVYDILEEEDLPNFKRSDIFLKYLTSTDPETENPKGTVDDYHVGLLDESMTDEPPGTTAENLTVDPEYMAVDRRSLDYDRDGLSISVEPEDDVVQAVQAAFDDIMQSRPATNAGATAVASAATADDASSSRSGDSSHRKPPSTINEDYAIYTHQGSGGGGASINESPRSSIESSRPGTSNALEPVDTTATTSTKPSSDLRSDLFGSSTADNENNIFPSESALFEETAREIFSDDSFSSEDEMDAGDAGELAAADSASIHRADPGDLGLTETIQRISDDINKLMNQDAVLETLLKKAELTNNLADLRILKKSKASVEREIKRKELQRQQYIVQESDNGLYGRSNVWINSAVTGSDNGRAYALYIIEVQRFEYDGSVSARWIVARRYSEFFQLHQHLRRRFPQVNEIDFPKKAVSVLKFQKSFIEARKAGLEIYLRALLQIPEVCHSREFRSFLSSQEFHGYHPSSASASEGAGGEAESMSAATAAAVAAAEAANKQKGGRTSRSGQSADIVARLYGTLSDGMEDIFGNFIVDYATHIPGATTVYNAAVRPRGSVAAGSSGGVNGSQAKSEIKHRRTGSTGNMSVMTQKSGVSTAETLVYSPELQSRRQFGGKGAAAASAAGTSTERKDIAEVEAELNLFEEATNSKGGEAPFIKPICDLFLELFDLNKGNNWIRGRASVVVLQQLLGGTIERKIREQIDNLVEENMVINLLNIIRDKVWPNGRRGEPGVARSAKEQAKTSSEAAFLLTTLVQDMAAKVVGSTNAKHASRRLFAMLQNKILNLHVICLVVDEIVEELFPEVRERTGYKSMAV
ncbi:PXA domain-containing protein [Myxozyma melibiosi]|uniref:PXA domain-containing protein n=1 Tax=Myxozyma melibiosi TaxID=54550 RepID=A0ABR1F8D3_9ASCO